MKHEIDRVKFWNLQFDEAVREEGDDRSKIAENILEKRASFIVEESKETIEALEKKDYVEVLDGLADLGFVCAGTVLECGLKLTDELYLQVITKMLTSAGERLSESLKKRDWEYVAATLVEIELIYRGIAGVFEFPYLAAFEEVFNSNMSKKDPVEGIVRNEVGKIMKPASYRKPDIQGVLVRSGYTADKSNV